MNRGNEVHKGSGSVWEKARYGVRNCCERVKRELAAASLRAAVAPSRLAERLRESKGQGTTEYAILVGVVVVIAIIAVVAFRDKLQELWAGIANGINGL